MQERHICMLTSLATRMRVCHVREHAHLIQHQATRIRVYAHTPISYNIYYQGAAPLHVAVVCHHHAAHFAPPSACVIVLSPPPRRAGDCVENLTRFGPRRRAEVQDSVVGLDGEEQYRKHTDQLLVTDARQYAVHTRYVHEYVYMSIDGWMDG